MKLELSKFGPCDIVLIVPPFCDVYQGHLACHLLQAIARQHGFEIKIVYGNLLFASMVGHDFYRELLDERLALEFVFQKLAFGDRAPNINDVMEETPALATAAEKTSEWVDVMTDILSQMNPKIIGSACSFEQITSSIAILERCIDVFPNATTIVGGANCEAVMADGFLSTGTRIHHIASGESEATFIQFLKDVLVYKRKPARILYGQPCHKLDDLPLPLYDEFFEQHDLFFGKDKTHIAGPVLPHETSRGCWWGEKHHCTFCGLNGGGMTFREKSPDRAIDEINTLTSRYNVSRLNMTDNIMPHRYFKTVLPSLSETLADDITIFYEQKANISFDKAELLVAAQIKDIQPGIEALDTALLKCMNKGTTGAQNLRLLRYGRTLAMDVSWNMLIEFPGDEAESYVQTLELVKLIPHLQPPTDCSPLRVDRFSPYFDFPEKYGIRSLEPMEFYPKIFPVGTNFEKLAYYFSADYDSGVHQCESVVKELDAVTAAWNKRWKSAERAILSFVHLVGERYILIDTRDASKARHTEFVSKAHLQAALISSAQHNPEMLAWLLKRKLVFYMDGAWEPLATAPAEILRHVGISAASEKTDDENDLLKFPAT